MVHNNPTPDSVQNQRDWNRTYQALADNPTTSNTTLRRRLITLSRRLAQDVPRTQQPDLRRRAEEQS
ncbi:hypothetical protein [Streptomyces luteocolor]|uniref:hypothetical protein n=1 Tax=Streptomyces luteocolor TaxID=285500 RepID=UPI000853718A|nr:hypothetical protein [Streptomyces luteocolor]